MAELYELLCCSSSHAPESELSRWLEAHHGFVPKISHRSGKNKKNLLNLNTNLTNLTDNMSPTDCIATLIPLGVRNKGNDRNELDGQKHKKHFSMFVAPSELLS